MSERLPNYDAWKTSTPEDYAAVIEIEGTVHARIHVNSEIFVDRHDETPHAELMYEHVGQFLRDIEAQMNEYGIEITLGKTS